MYCQGLTSISAYRNLDSGGNRRHGRSTGFRPSYGPREAPRKACRDVAPCTCERSNTGRRSGLSSTTHGQHSPCACAWGSSGFSWVTRSYGTKETPESPPGFRCGTPPSLSGAGNGTRRSSRDARASNGKPDDRDGNPSSVDAACTCQKLKSPILSVKA